MKRHPEQMMNNGGEEMSGDVLSQNEIDALLSAFQQEK